MTDDALPVPKAETDGVQLFMLGAHGRVPYPLGVAVSVINAATPMRAAAPVAPVASEPVALQELRNIVEAKRFDRAVFDDDSAFADWAVSRAMATLNAHPPVAPIASEEWIQEALRLANEWGRFACGPEFYEDGADEEWAALEAHLRGKG